ncbi:hypothetical protein SAMN05421539_111128, partial [Jannaschia seohaensis]
MQYFTVSFVDREGSEAHIPLIGTGQTPTAKDTR